MIKAVFYDIDGTIVDWWSDRPSDRVIADLAELHRRGLPQFIATGRNTAVPEEIDIIAPVLDYVDGFIGMNGQLCHMKNGPVLRRSAFEPEQARRIVALLELWGIPYAIRSEVRVFTRYESERIREAYRRLRLRPLPVDSSQPDYNDICMFTVFATLTAAQIGQLPDCQLTWWNEFESELMPAECGKELGVEAVCRHLGIDREQTLAFGDGENDITMLRYAGTGVAMGNAADEVKRAADYVTAPVSEDGVPAALRRFGLL